MCLHPGQREFQKLSDAESGRARRPRGTDPAVSFGLGHEDSGPALKCEPWSNSLPSLDLSFLSVKSRDRPVCLPRAPFWH